MYDKSRASLSLKLARQKYDMLRASLSLKLARAIVAAPGGGGRGYTIRPYTVLVNDSLCIALHWIFSKKSETSAIRMWL